MATHSKFSILYLCAYLLCWCIEAQIKDPFLVPGSSSQANQLFNEANSSKEQKNFNKAIEYYEQIMHSCPDSLVITCQSTTNTLYQNAHDIALANLVKLPVDVITSYHANSVSAKHIDENLSSGKSFSRLLLTNEGTRVFVSIVDNWLLQEKYHEALVYILEYIKTKMIFADKQLDSQDVGILARLAFCYYALGDKQSLVNLAQRKIAGEQAIIMGGESQSFSHYCQKLIHRIKERQIVLETNTMWSLYGKDVRNTFFAEEKISALSAHHLIPIPFAKQKSLSYRYSNEPFRNTQGPCQYYPVMGDETIFINNGKDILAYDLYSGELKWSYDGLVSTLKSTPHEQLIHSVLYHRGSVYANIEGDTPTQSEDSWGQFQIRKVIAERRLIKLDAATGNFIWQVRDSKRDEEAFANKASFMTPPIIWRDHLYVGATELSGLFNSYLVAINPENGNIVWKTLIGSAQQEMNMFGRPVRETVSARVVAGNGILYYLTNLGACSAVDPVTGRILWLYLYDRIPTPRPKQALFTTPYRATAWYNSPVLLANDCVYIAPLDANNLYCLDAINGQLKWQRPRGEHLYLLAAVDNKIIVGGEDLEFLDAHSGKTLKVISLYRDRVSGLGLVTETGYYCPTNVYLYNIDFREMTIADRYLWPNSTHHENIHMIIGDSIVVTTSSYFQLERGTRGFLNIFYDFQDVRAKLLKQTQEYPNSPVAYLKLANLYFHTEGNWGFYIETMYKKSYLLAREMPEATRRFYLAKAQQGLVKTYLRLAKENEKNGQMDKAHQNYVQALEYATDSATSVFVLLKQYHYYEQSRQYQKLMECLQQLTTTYGNENYYDRETDSTFRLEVHAQALLAKHYEDIQKPEEAVKVCQSILMRFPEQTYRGITVQKWFARQIKSLIQNHGREIYRDYDRDALQEYRRAIENKAGSVDFMRIINNYPNSQCLPDVYLQRAKSLLTEEKIKDAVEQLKQLIREFPHTTCAPDAHVVLIECYEMLKIYGASKGLLEQLESNYRDKVVTVGNSTILVSKYVADRLQQPIYLDVHSRYVPILDLWESNSPKYKFSFKSTNLLRLVEMDGMPSSKYQHLVFLNLGGDRFPKNSEKGILYCYDGGRGTVLWNIRIGWIRRVGFIEARLLAWGSHNIFCLDPDNGNILWEIQVPNTFVSLTLGKKEIAYISTDYANSMVFVHKADTGKMLWSAHVPGSDPEDLLIGQQVVVAFSKNPSVVYVYYILNGKLLKKWENLKRYRSDEWLYYPIITSENYLCMIIEKRWIECYRLPSLDLLWRHDGVSISTRRRYPIINGNEEYVFFAGQNNQVVALDLFSGDIKWNWKLLENNAAYSIIPDTENLYFMERLEGTSQEATLSALDINNGAFKWAVPITEEFQRVEISTFITQKQFIVLINRNVDGVQSNLTVYDKYSGQKLKFYEVKEGDRGRSQANLCLRADNLWLVKDNNCWVLGK